ncbi:MAG: outer membrane lipoprotein chaperone LolA [Porticoccaceae bacterium]
MKFMMKSLIVFITASLTILTAPVNSSESQVYNLLAPIQSFSANFNQHLIDPKGEIYQSLKGVLHAKKPDKVRWTVFEPAAQSIVSNGIYLWIYDPDLEQVIIEPYSNNPESNPISLLLGSPEQIDDHFKLTAQSQKDNSNQWFNLEPKQPNSLYRNLKIAFKNQFLSTISFEDNFGQTTLIELKDFQLNPLLSDKFFNFEIPDGVDILNHAL